MKNLRKPKPYSTSLKKPKPENFETEPALLNKYKKEVQSKGSFSKVFFILSVNCCMFGSSPKPPIGGLVKTNLIYLHFQLPYRRRQANADWF